MAYSFAQLEELWIQAGGPAIVAPVAAAIALAESSGDPSALNKTDNNGTQTSVGLWQISNGTHSYPAQWLNPQANATAAVAKYKAAGGTFARDWGTFTSGAYTRYLQGAAPATGPLPTAASSPGAQPAQLTSWWTNIFDPFQAVQDAGRAIGTQIGNNPASIITSVAGLAKDFNAVAGMLNAFLKDIEWLFVPSHWVRVFCFLFGTGALATGVWALMRTGSGQRGDITLALGILMVTVAGILLFLAFHNLPTDVKDLGGLLGYIAGGIQRAEQAPAAVTAGAAA
jgi:hypothetical protein